MPPAVGVAVEFVPPDAIGNALASTTPEELMVTFVTPPACSPKIPELSPDTIAPPRVLSALIVVVMFNP
jgi:hypothetical protein